MISKGFFYSYVSVLNRPIYSESSTIVILSIYSAVRFWKCSKTFIKKVLFDYYFLIIAFLNKILINRFIELKRKT